MLRAKIKNCNVNTLRVTAYTSLEKVINAVLEGQVIKIKVI